MEKLVTVTVIKGSYPDGTEIKKPISRVVRESDLAAFFRREEVFSIAKNRVVVS